LWYNPSSVRAVDWLGKGVSMKQLIFSALTTVSLFSGFVSAEVLERNTFSSQSIEVELGASAGYETAIDLAFDVHEELEVVITPSVALEAVTLTAKVLKGLSSTDSSQELRLQVIAQAGYDAASVNNIPVGIRLLGKDSGIVHYLANVNITVLPKITIRLSVADDDTIKWSTPQKIQLKKHNRPVEVTFLLIKATKEPVWIHGQYGPIPHAKTDQQLYDEGDTYTVLVESSDETAIGTYWEHNREDSSKARTIEFNAL
jgi:hypothetical protein